MVSVAALVPVGAAVAYVGSRAHGGDEVLRAPSAAQQGSHRGDQSAGSGHRRRASKLLVFVVENHSLTQMQQQMPWTYRLAQRFGYATRYQAIRHPSLPNYLAIAGGSTFGVADDDAPRAHPLGGHSVFGLALHAGLSAHVYAEDMPEPCALTSSGDYAVKHNPWPYFVHERRACQKRDVSMAGFRGDVRHGRLPAAGMVIPNLCNDAHDCSLATADAWLKAKVGLAMSGSDFKDGRLAIVVTADEDDGSQGNKVLTLVVQRGVHQVVTHRQFTHYSLCRLYTQILGVDPLREAAHAPSMVKAFGLRLRRS